MARSAELQLVIDLRDEMSRQLDNVKDNLQSLDPHLENIRDASAAAFGGLAVSTGFAVKKYADFEQKMSNINTLITGQDQKMKALTSGIKDMIGEVPVSADQLGAAAYDVLSAGVTDTSKAMKTLKSSAKLGVAGLGSTKEAVDLTTSAINSFGFSTKEVGKVSEVFFQTVRAGKNTIAELAQSFGKVAPIASNVGISLEELQAATATLTSTGLEASEAQNAIKASLASLQKPTKDMKKVMDSLGAKTASELINKSGGLVKAFQDIKGASRELGFQFADLGIRQEALGALITLTEQKNTSFRQTLEKMKEPTNALDDAYRNQLKTLKNQFRLLKGEGIGLMIEWGDAMAGSEGDATDLLKDMRGIVEETRNWIKENPELTRTITIATGAVAGFLTVLTTLAISIKSGGIVFTALKGLAGLLGSGGPIVGALLGTGGLIAVLAKTTGKFDKLKDIVKNTWDAIGNVENPAGKAFLALLGIAQVGNKVLLPALGDLVIALGEFGNKMNEFLVVKIGEAIQFVMEQLGLLQTHIVNISTDQAVEEFRELASAADKAFGRVAEGAGVDIQGPFSGPRLGKRGGPVRGTRQTERETIDPLPNEQPRRQTIGTRMSRLPRQNQSQPVINVEVPNNAGEPRRSALRRGKQFAEGINKNIKLGQ
jgi:TP901 family phage tail tape measure protein